MNIMGFVGMVVIVMRMMTEICTSQNTHPDLVKYATAMHAAKGQYLIPCSSPLDHPASRLHQIQISP